MNENMLTVVMYHYVRDLNKSRFPSIKGLDLDLFKGQIEYLQKNYNFVSTEEVIAAYTGDNVLPENAVLLTFDDGYIDHYTHVFPILYNRGIQGAFFAPVKAVTQHQVLDVNKIHFTLASVTNTELLLKQIECLIEEYTDEYELDSYDNYYHKLAIPNRFDTKEIIFVKRLLQVELVEPLRKKMTNQLFTKFVSADEVAFSSELYMNEEQMKCMIDSGMHIGSHGYDHYWLGSLTKQQQEVEIKESIKFLEKIGADINNWTICYPYGNYNEDTISLLHQYKCQLAFTTEVKKACINTDKLSSVRFKIPRLDTNDLPKRI